MLKRAKELLSYLYAVRQHGILYLDTFISDSPMINLSFELLMEGFDTYTISVVQRQYWLKNKPHTKIESQMIIESIQYISLMHTGLHTLNSLEKYLKDEDFIELKEFNNCLSQYSISDNSIDPTHEFKFLLPNENIKKNNYSMSDYNKWLNMAQELEKIIIMDSNVI